MPQTQGLPSELLLHISRFASNRVLGTNLILSSKSFQTHFTPCLYKTVYLVGTVAASRCIKTLATSKYGVANMVHSFTLFTGFYGDTNIPGNEDNGELQSNILRASELMENLRRFIIKSSFGNCCFVP